MKAKLLLRSAVTVVILAFVLSPVAGDAVPAFPGALGFGANATGGRGGTVYRVTTLADSGPGSFRDAVSQPNRIVVFEVGGYITLLSGVSVRENITIAGQTAPGGGIGFKGDEISFGKRSNIICRHIRVRPGSETDSNNDVGISLYNARNVILDHVSIEFAPWNNVGAVSDDWQNWPVTDVTFQNCLNANPTYQQFGAHTESVGSTMAWFYTIFANSHNRNPMSKINDVFVNNVLYNCSAGYTTHTSTEFDHDIVNNYFIAGPASGGNLPWYQVDNNQSIFYSGNYYDSDGNGALGGDITTPYWYQGAPYGTVLASPWSSLTATSVLYSARAAYRVAVSQAGAFPRDQMDDLVISQVKTLGSGPVGTGAGTAGPDGGLYSDQTQTGLGNNGYGVINGGVPPLDSDGDGMPDYFEQANGYNLGGNDAMTISADGYARIESYINWLAESHASTTTNKPVTVDVWGYTSGFTNASPTYAVANAINGSVTLSNDHFAVFTPSTEFIGMGGFRFSVITSDGAAYTNVLSIAISALQPPKSLTWRGDGSANVWTNGGPANWFDGTSLVAFTSGDNVTFDDTGSNTPSINLPSPLAAGSIYFVASQDYTIGGSGAILGAASLHKVGPGKLTLNTLNTFSGGTTIYEGIVQLGNGVSASGSLAGNITNHGELIFANPMAVSGAAAISGSGRLTKNGAGTLTLSGNQTYTNLTTINAGTLEFAGTPPQGDILNHAILTFKPSSSLTCAGTISGAGKVIMNASGQTLTLSGANAYLGGTTNVAGTLALAHNRAAGMGPVAFLGGAVKVGSGVVITNTFAFDTTPDLMLDTFGGGTCTWAGNIVPLSGTASFRPGGTDGKLALTGTAALGVRNLIIPKGSVEFAGSANVSASGTATAFGRNSTANSAFVTIKDNAVVALGRVSLGGGQNTGGRVTVTIQDNGSLSTGTETFDLHNSTRTATWTMLSLNGGTLAVGGFVKTKTGATQFTTNNFNGGMLRANQDNASFLPALSGLTANVQAGGGRIDDGGFAITIAAPLRHDSALGATADGGLIKLGTGTLSLTGTNTFTGPTLINAGTLALSGNGSLANSATIHVAANARFEFTGVPGGSLTLGNGRRISGDGSVSGVFTLGAGAVLAPGSNAVGRLTFNHDVTFASGSTNLIELSTSPLTNDVVKVVGSVGLGGTLIVTNLAGELQAGDSFKLFDAASYRGSFAGVVLPALPADRVWNTNELHSTGTISIVNLAAPSFGNISISGDTLTLTGSGGSSAELYYILASTDVALPAASWTRVATNRFGSDGSFEAFVTPPPDASPQFFRLQLP